MLSGWAEKEHKSQRDVLTIPAHRSIKPVHIAELVRFIDAVIGAAG